jgi:tetratricopeptide (TPR) repeat protein
MDGSNNLRLILRIFLITIIISFVSIPLIAGSADMEDIERFNEYLEEGKKLLIDQDYSGAIDSFTQAHSIDPYNDEVNRLIETTLKKIEQLDNEIYDGFRLLDESKSDEAYEVFQSVKESISSDDKNLIKILEDGFDQVAELRKDEYRKRIEESGREYVDEEQLKRIALLEDIVKKEEFAEKVQGIRLEARDFFKREEYEQSKVKWASLLSLVPNDEEAVEFLSRIDLELAERQRLIALAESTFQEGISFYFSRSYDEAIEKFKITIDMEFRVEESRDYIATIKRTILEEKRREEERARRILEIREEARSLFDNGEYEVSRTKWNDLLRLAPGDEQALIFISKIDFKLRESEKLLALAESYFQSGERLFNEKRYEEAVDQFENAIAMDFRVWESQDYLDEINGILLERQRKEDDKRIEKVAMLLRDGIKYYNLSQFKRSLSVLNEGLTLDPENSQIKEYIVRDIIALKREEEKEVPPSSPFYNLVENLSRLGNDSYRNENYNDAVKYYEEILLIFPFNEKARINLTRALSKTDPRLVQDILGTMYNEALSLLEGDKKREATLKLKLILDVDPGFSKARASLEKLEREQKLEKRVITDAEREKARELHMYGIGLYRSENLREAIKVWKDAVELDPDFTDARVYLARAETQLRNLEKYESEEDEEDSGYDDELRIKIKKHYLDGINLFMSGLYREAITEWEELLEIDPQNESARLNIQRARQRLEMEEASL